MHSAIISTNINTLILPKPKLDSRSFSDHFWSGPAATEVGDDVDYATEVGDDCDCCWDAPAGLAGPDATAPNHSRHPGLSHAKTKKNPRGIEPLTFRLRVTSSSN